MDQKIDNHLENCNVYGDYVGGNQTKNYYTSMFQDSERKFVVTHNATIRPTTYFTGRETELKDLRQRIEEGRKSVLVSGMGGIGKTHICRKLFEEYWKKHSDNINIPFRHLGYIEYDGDMDRSLMKCLMYKEQDSPKLNKEAAWRELEYLAADGKLLLFVDNVNVTIGEDAGLGRLKNIPGAVVLTSRRTSFSKEFEPYRIGFLSTEQCKEVYERIRYDGSEMKVPVEEVADLEYVINKLAAGHTITIEFLAHLAMTKHWNVEKLREELEQNGFCLEYRDEEDNLVNIQKSYETLYSLSGLSAAEQNILEAFSVFPYIPLAVGVCNQWLLSDAGVGEDADILTGLYRKGWLQFDIEQESYAMHPVFAQFIYEQCKPTKERHFGLIESCGKSLMPEFELIIEGQQYIPFAENIIEKMNLKISPLINILIRVLDCKRDLDKEEKLLKSKMGNYEEKYGINSYETARVYSDLAHLYEKKGEYEKASNLYEKGIKILENELGKEHQLTESFRDGLSDLYMRMGNYDKAKEMMERSLQNNIIKAGGDSQIVALRYKSLAFMYRRQEEYEKAEEMCEKSLDIWKKWKGDSKYNIYLCWAYIELADVCLLQGKYEKVKELCDRAWELCGTIKGDYGIIATAYSVLGKLYVNQKEFCRAGELLEKSLEIRKKLFGENHLDVAKNYAIQAEMYYMQNQYKKAEVFYEKAWQINERILGEGHPDTASSYNNLANVYKVRKEYKRALIVYLKAYKIFLLTLGKNHPYIQTVYKNMKGAYYGWKSEGNFEQWLEEQMKESDRN